MNVFSAADFKRSLRLGRWQQLPGPGDRQLKVGADVVTTQLVEKPRLFHHEKGLGVGPAQNELFAVSVQFFVQVLL